MLDELTSPLVRRTLLTTLAVAVVQLVVIITISVRTALDLQLASAQSYAEQLERAGVLRPCDPSRFGPAASLADPQPPPRGSTAIDVETSGEPPCDRLRVQLVPDRRGMIRGRLRLAAWTGAALMLALLVAVPLVRRIRRLERDASRVIERGFVGEVHAGNDELGRLARTFNHAVARARQTIAELAASRALLRDRLADLAHDVRTPLASLKLGIGSDDPDVQRTLRAEVEYLDRLFDNLASLTLLESDALPVEPRPLDLRELADQLAVRFTLLARDAGLALSVEGEPSVVHADSVLLTQVTSNLVHNALKHARSRVGLTVGPGFVEVRDDGPGMSPEALESALERQVHGSESTAGRGLGLAIARALSERQGARLELVSAVGEGTRAVVRWPTPPTERP
ncbi:MAG: HAMP domain-containing sensor histidine kinase, partial [Myxococcota bacterium]